jgi:hypothetical protein
MWMVQREGEIQQLWHQQGAGNASAIIADSKGKVRITQQRC